MVSGSYEPLTDHRNIQLSIMNVSKNAATPNNIILIIYSNPSPVPSQKWQYMQPSSSPVPSQNQHFISYLSSFVPHLAQYVVGDTNGNKSRTQQ